MCALLSAILNESTMCGCKASQNLTVAHLLPVCLAKVQGFAHKCNIVQKEGGTGLKGNFVTVTKRPVYPMFEIIE